MGIRKTVINIRKQFIATLTIGILMISVVLFGVPLIDAYKPEALEQGSKDFVATCGTNFCLNDTEFRFVGANLDALPRLSRDEIDKTFEEAQKLAIKVIRVWVNDPQSFPEYYQFENFDYMLDSARRHDIKLIIALASHRGIVEYRIRAHPELEGENPRELREGFFEDVEANELYRNFVHNLITRTNSINGIQYREDPTIFSWELMNEPDCAAPSLDVLTEWIEGTSSYIKSIDQNHMISTGTSNCREHFKALNSPVNISFCTFHIYPDPTHRGTTMNEVREVIDNVVNTSVEMGKPIVMEEYGISRRKLDHNSTRENWYQLMLDEFYSKDGDGTAFWAFSARSNLTEEELRIENGISLHPDDAELREIIKEKAKEIE